MPAVPTYLKPPGGASHFYVRSFATPSEQKDMYGLLDADKGKSPFFKGGKRLEGQQDLSNVNRRLAISTILGMVDQAAKDRGLPGGHIPAELQPNKGDDQSSYFWASGKKGPEQYGIVVRPGYLGAPRGLDALVRHEVAHASDTLNNQPKLAHGPSYRDEEAKQYIPGVKLMPHYAGTDYAGKDEYADFYKETGEKYKPRVYMSDYDNPAQGIYPVDVKNLKKAVAKNQKAYVANLKKPPVPTLRLGPAARGL